jgi:predicted lipoprotein with Yx(FWY)xxD motif
MSRSTDVRGRYGRRMAWLLAALVAGLALASMAAFAGAKTSKPKQTTVKTAHNSQVGATILVDKNGLTLYELKPETTHHLLCTSQACFGFWPPYTVSKTAKLSKASGVSGKLGKLHRGGFYQVTLDGHPLYHFSLDNKKKGHATGNGIQTFGGTWHVVKFSTHKSQSTTTTTSTATTTSTSSTYSSPYPY